MRASFLVISGLCGLAIASSVFAENTDFAKDPEACKQYVKKHEQELEYNLGDAGLNICAEKKYRKNAAKYIKCVDDLKPHLRDVTTETIMDRCVTIRDIKDETVRARALVCAKAFYEANVLDLDLDTLETCVQTPELLDNVASVVDCSKNAKTALGSIHRLSVIDDCADATTRQLMPEVLACSKMAMAVDWAQLVHVYHNCRTTEVRAHRKAYVSCLKEYYNKPLLPPGVEADGPMMDVSAVEPPCYSESARKKVPAILTCYEKLKEVMGASKNFNAKAEYSYHYLLTSCYNEVFQDHYQEIGKCMSATMAGWGHSQGSIYDVGARCSSRFTAEEASSAPETPPGKISEEHDPKTVDARDEKAPEQKPVSKDSSSQESK